MKLPTLEDWRVLRDMMIVSVALSLGVYEVVFGEGRLNVLGWLGGLLVSPAFLHLDEWFKKGKIPSKESS